MKKIDIIWFIEHISRELDVASAVSALISKKYNKSIKIAPLNSLKVFNNFLPSTVLLPYCYSIKDKTLRKSLKVWTKARFINLAWEQIFYHANLEYKSPRDDFAKKFVIHHAWSDKRKNFLIEKGVPIKNIFVNGNPAYSLYQNPYRGIFADKKHLAQKLNLNPKKKWLFFPENYSWYFYSDHNLEEIIKKGQSKEVVYKMKNYCGQSFAIILDWLNQATQFFNSEFEIILRPRPAFSLEYFQNKLKELFPGLSAKIHILKDYSVREWIMASDIVISSFSTSLIEAAIAQKSVFMLDPIKIPDELSADWYRFIPKIKTINSFFQIFENKIDQKNYEKLFSWARKEFFVNKDPIIGLVNYLGRFKPQNYPINKEQKNKIISASQILKLGLKEKIINNLGQIKRNLLDDKAYHQNDDEKKYEIEISNRQNDFYNFLNP